MAPSSGLSVLTKALHAATGPDSSSRHAASDSAPSSASTAASAASPSLSHTASEFGRHLKRALQEEWNKPVQDSRPPLRHPTDPHSSYATARSAISSDASVLSNESYRRVPPPPPPHAPQRSESYYAPPSTGVPGGGPVKLADADSTDRSESHNSQLNGSGKDRNSLEQVEAEQMREAMRASLRDEEQKKQPAEADDAALHQALVESEVEERHRQDEQAARERAEFALALAASRRSPTPPASSSSSALFDRPTPTNSRPHTPSAGLPAFSDTDLARSAYPAEKAAHHPQGRPALPPGAGGAWDDEMREMEMLALAIRISQEEEEERKRIEEQQLGEALRRSERESEPLASAEADTDAASVTSSLAPRITPRDYAGVGDDLSSPTASSEGSFVAQAPPHHPATRSRRNSWIQPPLASSMVRQASSTESDGSAETAAAAPPPRPPRPYLPHLDASAAAHVPAPSRPAPGPPTPTSPHIGASLQNSPPKPKRAAPPPPTATLPPGAAPASLAPFPRFQPNSTDELWRRENDGSPLEIPNLTPSSSIRGHSSGTSSSGVSRPTAYGAFGLDVTSTPGGSPRLPEELARRISQASTGSYATALSDPLGDTDDEVDANQAPLSPLSIRNPDLRAPTPSDGSRSSTLSSTSSADSAEMLYDPTWAAGAAGDIPPVFPAGGMGFSAYAGRSMSAISELTEPVSSAAATEDGASERVVDGPPSRADSFPSTVSIDSQTREEYRDTGGITEQEWIARGGRTPEDVSSTPRPAQTSSPALLAPAGPSSTLTGSDTTPTPPSGEPSGHSPTVRQGAVEPQPAGTTPLAQDDGLRCGYPAECARELNHVCPADGLSASAGIPETVELASDLPPNHTSWAIEAHSWVALVRALMWYGDTVVAASADDVAESPSARCAATASLEFRSDDEGVPILRLVLSLLPPRDPSSHQAIHRELRAEKTQLSGYSGKGKGKARAGSVPASSFLLPDVVHLPARLSSLAIQLYSLRHLASIARATQPSDPVPLQGSSSGAVEGYSALRELADAIAHLAQAAQGRRQLEEQQQGGTRQSTAGETWVQGAANEAGAAVPDQTQRLVDRLRARLRGLKRNRAAEGGHISSEDEEGGAERNARISNKLVKPGRRVRSSSQPPVRPEHFPVSQTSATAQPPGGAPESAAGSGLRGDMRYLPVLTAS
ncbi:hypothetical protein JCM10908_005269 [Rhodotorula pacifica]|uniref:uncharacterized protein n=1 Tax=Rhodotorula pacifica TaxID=1495444 RepID=UPI00317BC0EA